MPPKKLRFRPTVQNLETRRCLTGGIAVFTFDSLDVTAPSGATATGTDEIAIIAEAAKSGSGDDTDDADIPFEPRDVERTGEDLLIVNNGKGPELTPDGRQLVVAIKGGDANGIDGNDTDTFFSELGDDTTSDAGKHTYSSGGIYTITVTVIDDDTGQAVDSTDAVFSEAGDAESGASEHAVRTASWTVYRLSPGHQYN